MEEQLIKCLKCLIDTFLAPTAKVDSSEIIVDEFMSKAELALSPEARQELINHLDSYLL